MATYYDKGTGKEYEAIQWTGKNIDQIIAFVRKGTVKHNAVNRELTITNPLWDHLRYGQSVGWHDWLIRSGDRIDVCTDFLFTQSFIRLQKEKTVAAQPQTQDPFEPMRQVIDLDSYEYLNEAYPFYIQAIEHALTAGKTPTDIGKFVIENTSSRRDIGLLCEQAARHIQRKGQAA